MNFKEIKEYLNTNFNGSENSKTIYSFAFEDYDKQVLVSILGEFNIVDEYGGEGEGEKWYKVYHFIDHNVYAKLDGFYTSGDGVHLNGKWNDFFEVKPVEKTIFIYEKI